MGEPVDTSRLSPNGNPQELYGRGADQEGLDTDLRLETVLRKSTSFSSVGYADEPGCQQLLERLRKIPWKEQAEGGPGAASAALKNQREQPGVRAPQRLGPYELIERIGVGGMGEVYRARHEQLGRIVAIKLLRPDRLGDQNALGRFDQEIRAVGRLEHESIVQPLHADRESDSPYLVMEYVDGESLSTLLSRCAAAGERLPISQACDYIRQAALGLQYAHQRGVIHRDIKPSNLMVDRAGKIRILDLGLARVSTAMSTGENGESLTADGQVMGTIDYMAPEQMRDSRRADARSDVYALGATLYKLLCGQAPLATSASDLLGRIEAVQKQSPVPLRERREDVPAPLARLVHRMLEKSPHSRPQTAAEIASALRPFCVEVGEQLSTTRPGAGSRWTRPVVASVSCAMAALLLVAGAFLAGSGPGESLQTAGDRAANPDGTRPQPGEVAGDARPRLIHSAALVGAPAKLAGVKTWTIETRVPSGLVDQIAFRPDGKRVATAGADGTIRIWDADTRDLLQVIHACDGRVAALAWSPDGQRIASSGYDVNDSPNLSARIWNAETCELEARIPLARPATQLHWSSDARRLIGFDRTWFVVNIATGERQEPLPNLPLTDWSALSPDGRWLAIRVHEAPTLRVFELENLLNSRRDSEISSRFSSLILGRCSWSTDGTKLAAISEELPRRILIWDCDSWTISKEIAAPEDYHVIGWDESDDLLITTEAGYGAHQRLWATRIADESRRTLLTAPVFGVDYSRSGSRLVVAAHQATNGSELQLSLQFREGKTGRIIESFVGASSRGFLETNDYYLPMHRFALCWSPTGQRLAVEDPNSVRVWEVGTGVRNALLQGFGDKQPAETHHALAWSPNGERLVASNGAAVAQWRVADGQLLRQLEIPGVAALAWSHDGERIASTVWQQSPGVVVWNHDLAKRLADYEVTASFNGQVLWDARDQSLVVRSDDGTWLTGISLTSGKIEKSRVGRGVIGLHPRHALLAVANKDNIAGAVALLDPQSFQPKHHLLADSTRVTAIAWRADDSLVTLGQDQRFRTWKSGNLRRLTDSPAPTCQGEFSPDGKLCAWSLANRVFVNEVESGARIASYLSLGDLDLAISPSGHFRELNETSFPADFVYLVETEEGRRRVLHPEEFAREYGWKNDPTQAGKL